MSPVKYTGVKGVEDIIPPDSHIWQAVERIARDTFSLYGFDEIRPPIIEFTDVFVRSIGEGTDIVEKEMYTFMDKGGRSITLRPEGTAPVVRCYVEKNLHGLPKPQKFYYTGPMFRYERPQKGRQRQFYQIGAEAFGVSEPKIDAEIISMLMNFLAKAGLSELSLELNSIGCPECRPAYTNALKEFFAPLLGSMCADCGRRFDSNPLRMLDCKAEACVTARQGAPYVSDHLCGACKDHFEELKGYLDMLKIPFIHNPLLVRGLDYYCRTTFEATSNHLGSQKAVAAGGRYDRLVEEFGGPSTPAIGFAVGMERLVTLLKDSRAAEDTPLADVFVAYIGDKASKFAFRFVSELRGDGFRSETGYEGASLKSQMRRADKIGAKIVFIIGDEEIAKGKLRWKDLGKGATGEMPFEGAVEYLNTFFNRK